MNPGSCEREMRIRTDGTYEYRGDTINHTAALWDCNKTKAVVKSCESTLQMQRQMGKALNHPDMTGYHMKVFSSRIARWAIT